MACQSCSKKQQLRTTALASRSFIVPTECKYTLEQIDELHSAILVEYNSNRLFHSEKEKSKLVVSLKRLEMILSNYNQDICIKYTKILDGLFKK